MGSKQKKCLIVKVGAIGDVVMTVPAVRQLYELGYQIDWICGTPVAPLLRCYSWINPIVVNDRALLQGGVGTRLKAFSGLWRSLLFRKYDLCATLYYDPRYKLLSLPVRARRRVLLSRLDRTTRLIPGRHHADEFERILLAREDSVWPTSATPMRPDRLPASPLSLKTLPFRIALVPGGASNMLRQQTLRRWPVEHYVTVAKRLCDRGWEVVLLGGPDDAWVRPHFQGLSLTDCIGTLSLPEVIAVYDTCDGVVAHDTGPLHLSGLSHAAVVGIFGPTDPGCFLPRRPRVIALWGGEGFACRPCYDGRDFAPCTNNACMQQISPQEALAALDRLLL